MDTANSNYVKLMSTAKIENVFHLVCDVLICDFWVICSVLGNA